MRFFTLDDIKVENKTVGVRVDINSPIIEGKIEVSERIKAHCQTLKELSRKKAKVVVLAHQGRKGDKDYRELKKDQQLLSRLLHKKVKYVHDLFGKQAQKAIRKLQPGEILLLRNVRAFDQETKNLPAKKHAQSLLVKNLQNLFDYYVLDGFSVSHRSHASVVGFTGIPNIAGRVMERELKALQKLENTGKIQYLLGGAKPDDEIPLLESGFKKRKIENVMAAGVLGELFLIAKGYPLGKKQESLFAKGYGKLIPKLKKMLQKHARKILLPLDLAYAGKGKRKEVMLKDLPVNQETLDIGKKTIALFTREIKKAKAMYIKGPVGMYDKKPFDVGTKKVFRAIAQSRAYSIMGGGHSLSAAQKFISLKKISFVSLAGGALLQHLSGHELPGVKALERTKKL